MLWERQNMQKAQKKQRKGFTLIEVLIVVVILGILAATVLPQFTASTQEANEAAVVQNLQLLRSQIQLYRFQHDSVLPVIEADAGGTNTLRVLTERTDIAGTRSTSGEFGPYIVGQLPPNPFNGSREVLGVTSNPITVTDVDDSVGWLYNDQTGEIRISHDEALMNTDGTSQNVFDM
jgi:general secretion pathway protein G